MWIGSRVLELVEKFLICVSSWLRNKLRGVNEYVLIEICLILHCVLLSLLRPSAHPIRLCY